MQKQRTVRKKTDWTVHYVGNAKRLGNRGPRGQGAKGPGGKGQGKSPTRITAVPVTKTFRPGPITKNFQRKISDPEQYLPEKSPTGCPVPTKIGLPDPEQYRYLLRYLPEKSPTRITTVPVTKYFRPGSVPVHARKIPDGNVQSRLKLSSPETPGSQTVPVPAAVPARKIPDPDHSSTTCCGTCQKNPRPESQQYR